MINKLYDKEILIYEIKKNKNIECKEYLKSDTTVTINEVTIHCLNGSTEINLVNKEHKKYIEIQIHGYDSFDRDIYTLYVTKSEYDSKKDKIDEFIKKNNNDIVVF